MILIVDGCCPKGLLQLIGSQRAESTHAVQSEILEKNDSVAMELHCINKCMANQKWYH